MRLLPHFSPAYATGKVLPVKKINVIMTII